MLTTWYELRDIYNADEFDLFYQQIPTKTFHLKGERCAGWNVNKVCLAGPAAGNGVGEMLPMLLIGKTQKSQCFNGIISLPCQYWSQKKFWTNSLLTMQKNSTESSIERVG